MPVRTGERLTERQALAALLLPSANNIAIMLARRTWGSVPNFVRHMNRQAAALHMAHTVYTDPSGYDPATRSTPSDQIRIARAATHRRTFRAMVRRIRYRIPVAGTVYNKNTLLGRDGFVGIKTGSMSQSGGCLMFRSKRIVHGKVVVHVRRGDGPVRRRPDPGRARCGAAAGRPGGAAGGAGLSATRRGTPGASSRS